jgi:hypothetical protein
MNLRMPRRVLRSTLRAIASAALLTAVAAIPTSPAQASPDTAVVKFESKLVEVPSGFNTVVWDCNCNSSQVALFEEDTDLRMNTTVGRQRHEVRSPSGEALIGGFQVDHIYHYSLIDKSSQVTYAKFGPVRGIEGAQQREIKGLITKVVTEPKGLSVDVEIVTTAPISYFVGVGTTRPVPGPNGPEFPSGTIVRSAANPGSGSDSVELFGLLPATKYFVLTKVINSNLEYSTDVQTFTTKRRKITVGFGDVVLNDDSDYWSECDCDFTGWVDGEIAFASHAVDQDSGTWFNFATNFTTSTIGTDPLGVLIEAWDDDDDVIDAFDGAGLCQDRPKPDFSTPRYSGGYSLSWVSGECDYEGAAAEEKFRVMPLVEGQDENLNYKDSLATDHALNYRAFIEITVTYE